MHEAMERKDPVFSQNWQVLDDFGVDAIETVDGIAIVVVVIRNLIEPSVTRVPR